MQNVDMIVRNASELVTPEGPAPRRGADMGKLRIIPNGALAIHRGGIVRCGTTRSICSAFKGRQTVDAKGRVVMPGFVDPHTHAVFAGSRENDFELRNQGVPYLEIARKGGGILSSVKHFRAATRAQLLRETSRRLDAMLLHGITTAEIKSGYGLSLRDEIKALTVAKTLAQHHPMSLVLTFLGAHEIPAEYRSSARRRKAYTRLVTHTMLPAIAKRHLAEFCDIFCEQGVFSVAESRHILAHAKKLGFKLKLHADEIHPLGGAELAVELGAVSADHLVATSAEGVRRLANSNTIAVMLPATTFTLGSLRYAPARKLIDAGAALALSTDCNPGSSTTVSMPFVINVAAVYLKMTAAEAITAATLNAACAIDRQHLVGSLEAGKAADILILDLPNHKMIPYRIAHNPVHTVIKHGKIVVQNRQHCHPTKATV